jgi:bifunctional UDP-N-acetylglucosamine pyrophosphorylase/glucosamine-1-phosphate N-acetyltransferase
MVSPPLAIVILAAGKGTRMRSHLPKVMHELAGQPMLKYVIRAAEALLPQHLAVVVGPDMARVAAAAEPYSSVVQSDRLGTGHAVAAALPLLTKWRAESVLVLYGDTPLITPETLARLVEERRRTGAAVAVLGMQVTAPNSYGRLVLDGEGNLARIVETAEAGAAERAITLCNSGVMAIDGSILAGLLGRLGRDNAKGEYYLTQIVALARSDGRIARVVEAPEEELAGIDSRAGLAAAESVLQARLRAAAMDGGATLIDPATVWFSADTRVGRDVVIGPSAFFGPGVTIEDAAEIKAFCHIEGAVIRQGAIVGPFARLRPGTEIGPAAHVGNFVELKNAQLGPGAKANHLSYLGDAEIGAGSNVGAGTITCNYDGFTKSRTVIGRGVFIGSDTALVAPVTIGDGAMTGAGSVITADVAADATVIARSRQVALPGHAARFRARRGKKEGG